MTDFASRPGGVLFPKKKTNPNQPDFDGSLTIDPALVPIIVGLAKEGKPITIELAGWKKRSDKGEFLSLSAQEHWKTRKDRQQGGYTPRQTTTTPSFDDDGDIPF